MHDTARRYFAGILSGPKRWCASAFGQTAHQRVAGLCGSRRCRAASCAALLALGGWTNPTFKSSNTSTSTHSINIPTQVYTVGNLIIVGLCGQAANNGDTINVTSGNGDTFTVFTNYRNLAFAGIAWAISKSSTTQTITIADAAASTFAAVYGASAAASGERATSPEDASARGSNVGNSTTTPTVISGTPTGAGELFAAAYCSSTAAGTYTEDGNWTNLSSSTTNITGGWAFVVNNGAGAKTHAPTTSSLNYSQVITAFVPLSGSTARGMMMGILP